VVGKSCRTRGPSGGLTAAAARGLSGRADALYVINDVLGSFLLRANEVIDQVLMSACGTRNGHEVKASNAPSLDASLHYAAFSHLGPAYEAALCFQQARPLRSGRRAIVLGSRAPCLITLPIKFAPKSTKPSPPRTAVKIS
jgi:hypothetical protein